MNAVTCTCTISGIEARIVLAFANESRALAFANESTITHGDCIHAQTHKHTCACIMPAGHAHFIPAFANAFAIIESDCHVNLPGFSTGGTPCLACATACMCVRKYLCFTWHAPLCVRACICMLCLACATACTHVCIYVVYVCML
jgi:hypothetical protein